MTVEEERYPSDWTTHQIHEVIRTVQLGGNYKNSEAESEFPLIKMGNLDRGQIKLDKVEYIDRQSRPSEADRLNYGDLLFNTRNTLDLVGKVAIWRDEIERAYFNSNIMRIKFNEKVSSDFFMNSIFNTPKFIRSLRDVATGTTSVAAIYARDLFKIQIQLPTKVEQSRIAEVLETHFDAIQKLEKLIAKKRDIKQATMQQLLTGKTRLPGFNGKWSSKRISDICSMKSGEGITSRSIDQHSPYPCYGGNGLRGFTTRFTHNGKYALIGRVGALCGNVRLAEGKFFASEHAIVVSANEHTDICWLSLILGEMRLSQYSEASAQPVLTVAKLMKLEVTVPSEKNEQAEIGSIITSINCEISAQQKKLEKLKLLKQGMMQELLTGRIRLI